VETTLPNSGSGSGVRQLRFSLSLSQLGSPGKVTSSLPASVYPAVTSATKLVAGISQCRNYRPVRLAAPQPRPLDPVGMGEGLGFPVGAPSPTDPLGARGQQG
jgi:hypothetical protein